MSSFSGHCCKASAVNSASDGQGRVVDFANTLIILTSNLGSQYLANLPDPTAEDEAEEAEFIEDGPTITYDDEVGEVNEVHQQLSLQDLQQAQEADDVLAEVRRWVQEGTAPSRAELRDAHPALTDYRQVFSKETFIIKQGVLYFTRRLNTPGEGGNVLRICLPPPLQQGAWSLCHEHALAGHRGKDTTLHKMVSRFFFIHMADFVSRQNDKCNACIGKIKFLKHKQT